jgi:hypothetical protein
VFNHALPVIPNHLSSQHKSIKVDENSCVFAIELMKGHTMKDFEALPDISLIAHIEDHARQTPNRVALYRRVITPTSAALTLYLPLFLSSVFSILIYTRVGTVWAAISFLVTLVGSCQITKVFKSKIHPQDWLWEPVTYSTVATDIHTYARKLVLGGGK